MYYLFSCEMRFFAMVRPVRPHVPCEWLQNSVSKLLCIYYFFIYLKNFTYTEQRHKKYKIYGQNPNFIISIVFHCIYLYQSYRMLCHCVCVVECVCARVFVYVSDNICNVCMSSHIMMGYLLVCLCIMLCLLYILLKYVTFCLQILNNSNRMNSISFNEVSPVFYVRMRVILRSCSTELVFDTWHTFTNRSTKEYLSCC